MTTECVRCGSELGDGALVCHPDAKELAQALVGAAGHAEDAETVIARQTRYGAGGRGGKSEPLPVDLLASAKLTRIANAMHGWARIVEEETGRRARWRPLTGPLCPPTGARCDHWSCEGIRRRLPPSDTALAAAWLARNVEWLRRHPAAGEAFRDLHAACDQLARLVDRPATGDRLVGMCDCGKILYAPHGRDVVQCRPCGQRWNVTESQAILLEHLDGKLVTVAEALDMAGWLDVDRSREQIRKLVTRWIDRGLLAAHGYTWRDPTEAELRDDPETRQVWMSLYRFGEIRQRLAETPRRAARETAEMGA
jgi:hypothetical protein